VRSCDERELVSLVLGWKIRLCKLAISRGFVELVDLALGED